MDFKSGTKRLKELFDSAFERVSQKDFYKKIKHFYAGKKEKSMDSESSTSSESFDDDIKQCRADILRARQRANAAEVTDTASDADNSQVRIPKFEDIVSEQNNPVEAQWETPSGEPAGTTENSENNTEPFELTESTPEPEPVEPISEPAEPEVSTETEFDDPIEIEMQESSDFPAEKNQQEEPAHQNENINQVELNLDNIVTAAEEMALFSKEEKEDTPKFDQQNEQTDDNNDGMDSLRQAVTAQKKESSIPSFDLAHKILTEQRKVASKRRQRPGVKRDLSSITPPVNGIMGRVIEENKKQPEKSKEQDNIPEIEQVKTDKTDTPVAEQTSQTCEIPSASAEAENPPKFEDTPKIELEPADPVVLEKIAKEEQNEHDDNEVISDHEEEITEDTTDDQEQKPAEEIEYTETPQVADEDVAEIEEAPEFTDQPDTEDTPEILNENFNEGIPDVFSEVIPETEDINEDIPVSEDINQDIEEVVSESVNEDIPETLDEEKITEDVSDFTEEPEEAADDISIEDDFSTDMDDELDLSLETIIEPANESEAELEELSELTLPAPSKMSAATCGIIKNAGHLNSRQKLIIANIVKKDIENFCKAS